MLCFKNSKTKLNKDKDKQRHCNNNENDNMLAILDKEYNDIDEDKTYSDENNDNNKNDNNVIYPFPDPIGKEQDMIEKDMIVKPTNDKPHMKSKKIISSNNNTILEPEGSRLKLLNLFSWE